ncbi:uncharacterized protein [Argopecten irradians]|uniref:uncharacterized protein n=1 Tax=Argopecten irradians TaxID=31199 RepID=UPI00371954CD
MKTGFKVGGKAGVKLGYPKIANISLGINSELSIGNDTDTCKTHTLTWNTENSVVVQPHTELTAEMKVEDREFTGTFHSNVAVSGVFEVEIKDRKNIDTIHCARGTIGEIINTWTKSPSGGKLENVKLIDNGAIAIWPVTGSYYYRCGVELTIETRTEPLTTGHTEYAKICD